MLFAMLCIIRVSGGTPVFPDSPEWIQSLPSQAQGWVGLGFAIASAIAAIIRFVEKNKLIKQLKSERQ